MVSEKGKHLDLIEDMNGGNAKIVYLKNKDPDSLAKQYNEIKLAKQIVNAYATNGVHFLAVYLDKRVIIKKG